MTRAADPVKGHELFISKCQSCHGVDGQGLPKPEDPSTKYPRYGAITATMKLLDCIESRLSPVI